MAGDALVPLDHHWLALCLCTESNRRTEWPLIAAVIQNRVRSKRYPDDWVGVILQPMQFSAFNAFTKNRLPVKSTIELETALFEGVASKVVRAFGGSVMLAHAIDHAALMLERDADGHRITDLITTVTHHYFSPVSMVPKGKPPAWAKSASRLYTPEGIDPQRFVFAENVP
jgi:hypothetical protein